MKLYGKELDKELAKRKKAKEKRRAERKTLHVKAKELKIRPSQYLDWENGVDVCSHEEYKKWLGGIHPPFILYNACTKCGRPDGIASIKTDADWETYKDDIEEALINAGKIEPKAE